VLDGLKNAGDVAQPATINSSSGLVPENYSSTAKRLGLPCHPPKLRRERLGRLMVLMPP
jgi:hypothetical protein